MVLFLFRYFLLVGEKWGRGGVHFRPFRILAVLNGLLLDMFVRALILGPGPRIIPTSKAYISFSEEGCPPLLPQLLASWYAALRFPIKVHGVGSLLLRPVPPVGLWVSNNRREGSQATCFTKY